MALGDDVVRQPARSAVLSGLATPGQIRCRQAVLTGCVRLLAVVREICGLAVQVIEAGRYICRGFFGNRGEAMLHRSMPELEMFTGILKQPGNSPRTTPPHSAPRASPRFFGTLRRELDDACVGQIARHLRQLRFRDGVLASAQPGEASQDIGYVPGLPHSDAYAVKSVMTVVHR